MDNVLERLRHMGIEKIREDTNLDVTKIDCILNKKFEKLDSVRARGFINILEKQYNLDLSSWLEEYRAFHHDCPQEEKKIEETFIQTTKKTPHVIWWIVGVVGGMGLILLLFSFVPKIFNKKIDVIKEAVQKSNTENVEEVIVEVNPQGQDVVEENKPQIEQKKLSEYGVEIFPNIAFNEENILYIESEKPLWVGIINIDNKKRIAKTKQEFDIPLDKQLLISIARSGFTLNLDEESKEFKGYLPVYLIHTKDGGLREISKDEFIYLNGGVQW